MVVKWFNYFQVSASASELSLLCFFNKYDFYPHDSLRTKESCVRCSIWNHFGCFNDLVFQKNPKVSYHWNKKSIYLSFGLKQVRKNRVTQLYLTFI
jgi:hypothetical protein